MRQQQFNMIEVLLAIGVVAIGVVSVMALLPYGLTANRDAAAETYAANAAEHLLHSLKYTVEQSGNWALYIDGNTKLTDTRPANLNTAVAAEVTGAGVFGSAGTIHEDPVAANLGIYHILSFLDGNGNDSLDGVETVDFRCIAGVWKSSITIDATNSVPRAMGVTLNVEVQWPAEISNRPDGTGRRKRLYTLELFNPNL